MPRPLNRLRSTESRCPSGWHGPGFRAELNRRRREVSEQRTARLREFDAAALEAVSSRLDTGDPEFAMNRTTGEPIIAHGVQLVFGASEPHLVPMYMRLGQRPYAPRNFSSEESGYLVPNVSIPADLETAHAAGKSPEFGVPFDWKAGAVYQSLPGGVRSYLDGFGSVRAAALQGADAYWEEVRDALARARPSTGGFFEGMTEEAVRNCVEHSIILKCHRRDHIVKRHGTARNMYLVLAGTFEAREGDRVIRRLGPGEVFGESGFLLGQTRSADVFATSETGRLLSLSDRSLHNFVEANSDAARALLLNLVSILAQRLAAAGGLTG